MAKSAERVVKRKSRSAIASLPVRGHRIGRIAGYRDGAWLVALAPGAEPIAARTTLANLGAAEMKAAANLGREALIVFENESPDRPIVVGLLAEPAAEVEVVVDGRRVTLDARDEIVLRCGQASITLRRNGRVVIRGTYVETRAQGVNRIKGGSVQIN